MLGDVGGVEDAEGPAGDATAQADLADLPPLAEGDDADGQGRLALAAVGGDDLVAVGEVNVDEHGQAAPSPSCWPPSWAVSSATARLAQRLSTRSLLAAAAAMMASRARLLRARGRPSEA